MQGGWILADNKLWPSLAPAAAAVATAMFGGCVAMCTSPIGGGAGDGPKVFAQIRKAAAKQKLSVMTRRNRIFVVAGEEGLIEFSLRDGRVKMAIIPETHGLYEPELKQREARLTSLGRVILRRARRTAQADMTSLGQAIVRRALRAVRVD